MKIVLLEGSPNRQGSSHMLAEEFAKGAGEAGHKVVSILLHTVRSAPARDVFPAVITGHVCRKMTWSISGWKSLETICW